MCFYLHHPTLDVLLCSVGKSTLLTLLTGTQSEAAAYEFTTLTCIPGIINYNDAKIQLLDLPGIIEGASEGKGRGRQVRNGLGQWFAHACLHLLTSSVFALSCYFSVLEFSFLIFLFKSFWPDQGFQRLTPCFLSGVCAGYSCSEIIRSCPDGSRCFQGNFCLKSNARYLQELITLSSEEWS